MQCHFEFVGPALCLLFKPMNWLIIRRVPPRARHISFYRYNPQFLGILAYNLTIFSCRARPESPCHDFSLLQIYLDDPENLNISTLFKNPTEAPNV